MKDSGQYRVPINQLVLYVSFRRLITHSSPCHQTQRTHGVYRYHDDTGTRMHSSAEARDQGSNSFTQRSHIPVHDAWTTNVYKHFVLCSPISLISSPRLLRSIALIILLLVPFWKQDGL